MKMKVSLNLSGRQLRTGAEIFSKKENLDHSHRNFKESEGEETINENVSPPNKKKCEEKVVKNKEAMYMGEI